MQISWASFKTYVLDKSLSIQYAVDESFYFLIAGDFVSAFSCQISRTLEGDAADLADFETNFLPTANAFGNYIKIAGEDNTVAEVVAGRIKIDAIISSDQLIKVSSDDQTSGYLGAKVIGTAANISVTVANDGADEDLQIDLIDTAVTPGSYGSASAVGTFTVDSKGRLTAASTVTISITSAAITDFTEAAQDAVFGAIADSSSVDFTYNDAGNSFSASVIPGGVDHNSLANLTAGDVHTQYTKAVGAAVTNNAIVRFDGTGGRTIQNSLVTVDDNGGIVTPVFIRVGATADTTNGNIQYTSNELLGRCNGTWTVLGTVPTTVSATGDTSTTSATYTTISSMTSTPGDGTYLVIFHATVAVGNNTSGDIALFVNGSEQTAYTKRLSIAAGGLLGAVAAYEVSCVIIASVTVTAEQVIDIRFRENDGGTVTVGPRSLTVIPIAR